MGFIDYYEALQLSSNADNDTIERVFRHLAKKFHPDNTQSADKDRFQISLTLRNAQVTMSNIRSIGTTSGGLRQRQAMGLRSATT
jgi:preprotein translocase subunit Sec63